MATIQAIGKVTEFKSGISAKGQFWQNFRLENEKSFPYPLGCFYMGDEQLQDGQIIFIIGTLVVNEYNNKSYQKCNVISLIFQNSLTPKKNKELEKEIEIPPLGETLSFEDSEIPF